MDCFVKGEVACGILVAVGELGGRGVVSCLRLRERIG
jgi:hypothetical protein